MGRKNQNKRNKKLTKFENRSIDLVRFAYDVIVHSALKFGVPQNSIYAWEDCKNDYKDPNFLSVMSRKILGLQLMHRYEWHKEFNHCYETHTNDLESFTGVGDLFKNVIWKSTRKNAMAISEDVVISLSVACELVIFLYSKNLNSYVKKLAEHWLEYYLLSYQGNTSVKKLFENQGGLVELFKVNKKYSECIDSFYVTFINVHCNNYETSAKDETLGSKYRQSVAIYAVKKAERSAVAYYNKEHPIVVEERVVEICMPSPSEPDEASGNDPLENTGLGIIPHEELLQDDLPSPAGTAPSQNVPEGSSQETTKHRRTPSDRQKRRSSLSSSVKQGREQVSLHSSGTKQSSGEKSKASVAHDPTPAQKSPATSPQDLSTDLKTLSGHQESKSSLSSSVEQSLGQLSLDSSVKKRSTEEKPVVSAAGDPTSSQNLPGASCQESAKEQGMKSRKKNKSKSSVCSSMGRSLGELSLDSSSTERSSEEKSIVSVADDSTSSQNLPGVSCQESAKEQGMKSRKKSKSKSSVCSSVGKSFEQLSVDSSATEPSSEEKPIVSAAGDPTSSENLPGASCQESAKEQGMKSQKKNKSKSKSSVCSRVEKSLGQLSLDSSSTERSSEEKSIVSVADDSTSSQNLPGVSCQESAKEQRGLSGQTEGKSESDSNSSEEEQ